MIEDRLTTEISGIAAAGLTRRRRVLDSRCGRTATVDGREMLNFASNDYLGLAGNAELARTLAEGATDTFTVDWKGYLAGATPTASWEAGAGTLAGAAVSGATTSARLGGLSEGETATVTVTATSGTTVGVMRFRVACPDFNARITGGI